MSQELSHDPLCRYDQLNYACMCPLIARVRADQSMIDYAKHLELDYERTGESWEAGYKMGREHEREACIKIVQSVGGKTHYWNATWAIWRNETLRLLGFSQ